MQLDADRQDTPVVLSAQRTVDGANKHSWQQAWLASLQGESGVRGQPGVKVEQKMVASSSSMKGQMVLVNLLYGPN